MLPGFDLVQFASSAGLVAALIVVAIIIFAESGLLIGFFLPGDSILFTLGFLFSTFSHSGIALNIHWAIAILFAAAVLGDNVGYYTGKSIGPRLFRRKDSRFFKQENVEKAKDFYDKYGGKTIILARFMPIVRTFVPIVAGVTRMNYKKFFAYNVIGGLLWTGLVGYLGYFLGALLTSMGVNIDTILLPIIVLIVLVSISPAIYHATNTKTKRRSVIAYGRRLFKRIYVNPDYQFSESLKAAHVGIGFLVGAIIFFAAYVGMSLKVGLFNWDQPILDQMLSLRSPSLTIIMSLITALASTTAFILISAATVGWAFWKKEVWRPFLLLLSFGLATIISYGLKLATANPRPPESDMVPAYQLDFSFPSGHVIITATFLLVLGYLIYSRKYNQKLLAKWLLAALIGTLVIAFSRLYLGYHWLTDVTASVGLSLIILSLVVCIDWIGHKIVHPSKA